jgi:hypothetical protein
MQKLYRFLLTGCFVLLVSSVFGQTSLHYWDFNSGSSGTTWPTPIPATQTIGSGSLSHPFGSNTNTFAGSTVDAPGFTTATAGASFSVVGTATNNQSFILTVPTTGYQDVKLTYATQGSGTGHTTQVVEYSTDGTTYTTIATFTGRNTTPYALQTVDFSALPATDNNANFKIRVTVSGATSTSGNNRFDNIRLSGAVFSGGGGGGGSTTVSVANPTNGAEGGSNGTFTITYSSATSASTTVDYAFTGTATFTTDYTVSFSAGTPSGSGSSGTLTVPSGTTSITVTVTPVDDASSESTETVVLTLSNPGTGYSLGTASGSLSITDNDIASSTISYNGNYYQDFNTLANTGTSSTLPTGWRLSESGTSADNTYGATDGSANSGNTYSFGATGNTERAFGTLRSGSNTPTIGAVVTNNTGATISSLQVSFTGEQWRLGATNRSDRLDFQYSLDATSLTSGTWVDVDGLDFIAPVSSGTAGALDGNATGNKRDILYTINGLSIPAGANFMIRWLDSDASGADDGLAIDEFRLMPGCTPPTHQPTTLNLTPGLQSISGSFTAAAAGSTNADSYLVLISTSSTLSEQPVTGNTYAADDVVGNARVISIGSSTTFNATGLTPGTPYYFFVYSYVAASNCYNLISPLTNNTSTTTPPPCTAPSTQASSLNASNVTATSMDISYVRGNGDNVLVVARSGSSVNANPLNSVNYPTGTEIGSGNFVVYNGPASSFTHSGLAQNTNYYYAVYEYNSADYCYNQAALTGSFATACTTPVDVSSLAAGTGNASVTLTWSNPTASCFDEVIVVASTSSITGTGGDYTGSANSTYGGSGTQVVYRGSGTNVTVTGLTNGTNYFFKVFTRKGVSYSTGVQVSAVPFDPSSGYTFLFGNIHAHSSYSDGNKDDLSKTPDDDYAFARDALCMDFLGISEHNHSGAGLSYPEYKQGYAEANSMNLAVGSSGNSIVTLWGMEWGVISGGGHVLVYGFDADLVGWESGNYDIFVAKNDYASLWSVVNSRPGAIATLAHPNSSDYGSISSTYNSTADNAIVGVAVESGPAFSTSKTYNDFPSSLSYLSYFRTMLARGYHLAPQMDQDNHNMTFGTANSNRMVVLSTGKSREALMQAIKANRYYASQDCNLMIDFKRSSNPMGSSVTAAGVPTLSMTATDTDGEGVSTIQLFGGQAGGGTAVTTPIKTYSGTNTFSFSASDAENIQPDNSTWYYYAIITQEDGNKAVTAPIWYTRNDAVLPVTLTNFRANYDQGSSTVMLNWTTAHEFNSKNFEVEYSTDGNNWSVLGKVPASTTGSILSPTCLPPRATTCTA